jgi:uncharacterized protein involved in high-affinity Fe2+ transport
MSPLRPLGLRLTAVPALALFLAASPLAAAEFPAGPEVEINGLQVQAVYLQAVEMAPPPAHQHAGETDIHLEADVKAIEKNPQGFEPGAWMPYLKVEYTLSKQGSAWKKSGTLIAMVADDGPHYGANIKLDGPGKYDLLYVVSPPDGAVFPRHVDKETGVPAWWKPFEYRGSFTYVGTGKKGGY